MLLFCFVLVNELKNMCSLLGIFKIFKYIVNCLQSPERIITFE